MPTTITRYVNTDSVGGDGTTNGTTGATAAYASLSAACDAIKTAYPNFITSDVIVRVLCSAPSGVADTTAVTLTRDDIITNGTQYLTIEANGAAQAAEPGGWRTDRYRLDVSADPGNQRGAITLKTSGTLLKGLQVRAQQNYNNAGRMAAYLYGWYGYGSGEAPITAVNCRFELVDAHTVNVSDIAVVFLGGMIENSRLVNCLVRYTRTGSNGATDMKGVAQYPNNTCLVDNTLVVMNRGTAVDTPGGMVARNVVAVGSTVADFSGTFAATTGYNVSSDGTAPGSNSRTNQTVTFVDAAAGDYRLAGTDTACLNVGTDRSSETLPYGQGSFTFDMVGTTRSGTWDIGPMEFVPPAGTTYYLLDTANADGWGDVQVGGTAPSAATMSSGWTVSTTASGNYSKLAYGSERAANTFSTTAVPGTAPDNTLKDAFRIGPVTGTFAAGTWTISVPVIAVTAQGGADGRLRARLFKSANATGASATEVTSGAVTLSTVTDVTTGAQQVSSGTVSLGQVALSNEYLFLCLAWEITGAAS